MPLVIIDFEDLNSNLKINAEATLYIKIGPLLSISLSSSFSLDLLDLKKFFSFHSCLGYGAGGVSFSSSTLDSGSGSDPSSGILDFLRKLNRKFNLFLAGFSASLASSAVSGNSGEGFLDVVMGQIPEIRILYPHFLLKYRAWNFGYRTQHYLDVNGVVGNDFVVIGSGVSSRILTEFRTFGSGFFVVIIFD